MNNSEFLKVISHYFGVYEDDNYIELETWTDGGVNMFVTIDKTSSEPYIDQFENYVNDFDIDEEIDVHRQDTRYKNAFSISESVYDFKVYKYWLISLLNKF